MLDGGRPGRLAGWQTGTGFDLSMHGLTNNWLEVPLTLSRGLLREELSLGREREGERESSVVGRRLKAGQVEVGR